MKRSTLNISYFDKIDIEDKAYWLGFIWSDGYMCIRERGEKNRLNYEFKLSLAKEDKEHLEKFKKYLESDFIIKEYKTKTTFDNAQNEVRLMIYNKYFCSNLVNNYGLIPRRNDISLILERLPKELYRHFIRGVLDADGSFNYYIIHNTERKATLNFSSCKQMCNFINQTLIEEGLTKTKQKLFKRHKDKDINCEQLCFSGSIQVTNILNWIYKEATIYLDRKYEKYLKKWN